MTTHPLITSAIQTLEDPNTPSVVERIAVRVVVEAVETGVLPGASAGVELVWAWIKRHPSDEPWGAGINAIDNERVRADVLDVLRRGDSGSGLIPVAFTMLEGAGHVMHVGDELLADLVERYSSGPFLWAVASLIARVQETRGVAPELLLATRDRWAASASPEARQQAAHLFVHLGDVDLAFAETMLADDFVAVRVAMADSLADLAEHAAPARPLLGGRLVAERHPAVRAALLRALAAIEDEMPQARS